MIEETKPSCLQFRYDLPSRGNVSFLRQEDMKESRALMAIGHAVFEIERFIKAGQCSSMDILFESGWRKAELKRRIKPIIERLIDYVLLSNVDVSLLPRSTNYQLQKNIISGRAKSDAVCLFSGGIDSLSGILAARERYRNITAVFCSHLHQSRVVSLVRKFRDTVLRKHKIKLVEIPVPRIDTTGYAHTRGFLYILSAAAVASAVGASRIVVSECGTTMYQPQFSAADQVTMTTHPFVVSRAQDVIQELSSRKITIETPFENNTKAEVMAMCKEPDKIAMSHSCISQRLELHDGTCYGCVIRRLGGLAAAVPDTEYDREPLTDDDAQSGNLLSLLDYCADILTSGRKKLDYRGHLIDAYNKRGLYRRFSLDNFAAIYQLKSQKHRLIDPIESTYMRICKRIGGESRLRARIEKLEAIKRRNLPTYVL